MTMDYRIVRTESLHQGFMQMESYDIDIERFDGTRQLLRRECVLRGDAAAALVHDPERDLWLLVEQFRPGVMSSGESPWLLELVAGMVEEGESAEDVVRREALEEANVVLQSATLLQRYWVSPGGTNERVAVFYATADLGDAGGCYGLASEGEDIRVHVLSSAQLRAALDEGRIANAMTLIAVQAQLLRA